MNWKHAVLALLLALFSLIMVVPLFNYLSILAISTIMELLLLLIALLVGRIGLPWSELIQKLGLRKPSARWVLISLLGGVLAWVSAVALSIVISLFFPYPQGMAEATSSIFVQSSLLDSVLWTIHVFVFVGFCEEILFRGVIQRGFEGSIQQKWIAVLISSLLFGAIHLDLRGLLPRALLGAVFGYLYIKSDYNIVVPSIAHGLNDFISIVLINYII
jgi:membrane protease YdiL (CAAX protease family)